MQVIELKNGAIVFKPRMTFVYNENSRPFAYCRLCGAVKYDDNELNRRKWAAKHSDTHSKREHQALNDSNLWVTPEAQNKLAPHGLISITDIIENDEIRAAGEEAPRVNEEVLREKVLNGAL